MRILVLAASEKPMTLAPSRLAAVSKLSLVLVDGSKKMQATTLSLRKVWDLLCSISSATSRTCRISSLVKSWIDIKLLAIYLIYYMCSTFASASPIRMTNVSVSLSLTLISILHSLSAVYFKGEMPMSLSTLITLSMAV